MLNVFVLSPKDLRLAGSLRLRVSDGHLDMTEFQSVLSLNSLKSNISGVLGSEEMSIYVNMMLEDLLPEMLDTYSSTIGEMISEYLIPFANKYLHELTLSDLIGGGNDENKCSV